MKNKIIVYTVNRCMYCAQAKRLLENLGLEFEEIKTAFGTPEMDEAIEKTGHMTAPLIFINDTFVGGYTDLERLVRAGKIQELLIRE
ncbi:MAG: glutaredoxin domain-containing protein [Anaerofustis sp.]